MGDVARRASTHAGFVVASAHMPRVATVKAPKATARKSVLLGGGQLKRVALGSF